MDNTLNEFLSEIDEIIPLKLKPKTPKPNKCDWLECLDKKSGFSYYWNTKTDEVTWDKPKGYIPTKSTSKIEVDDCPPVPSDVLNKVMNSVTIYKLAPPKNTEQESQHTEENNCSPPKTKKNSQKKLGRESDSDDEKITLITSYGSESEDEEENEKNVTPSPKDDVNHSSNDEEDDILSTVRKRAEEMKKLTQDTEVIQEDLKETSSKLEKKASISGFSLVAGYDSNSEDEEEKDQQNIFPSNQPKVQSHSTLFPIVKPPDVNDFISKEEGEQTQNIIPENSFDTKNFKRKRRLGVSLMSNNRGNINPPTVLEGERRGFGFRENDVNTNKTNNSSKSFYSNFTSGGIEFVKNETSNEDRNKDDKNEDDVDVEELKHVYEILHEKLLFLCEGNKDVMPVQIILIQIETLFGALKANCLKTSYLYDWLEGTSEDLIKLEKEAAPEGWILQWDRSEKRYYYHNESTGEGQWEYPQQDLVRQEEAMDICTTPPPPDLEDSQPPLPASPVKSPSPPPPPIISEPEPTPMPEPPSAPNITSFNIDSQPLPPGVDYSESPNFRNKVLPPENNDIKSAFDSFYSEIAALENNPTSAMPPSNIPEQPLQTDVIQDSSKLMEPPKKKKKKIKMGQGLSLKKKDVSKLVEKWKNVQKNY